MRARRGTGAPVGRTGYRLALFVLVAQVALAVYAPLVASDRPLILVGGDRRELRRETNTVVGVVTRLAEWKDTDTAAALDLECRAFERALRRIDRLIEPPGAEVTAGLERFEEGVRYVCDDSSGYAPDRVQELATGLPAAVRPWRRTLLDRERVQVASRAGSPLLRSLSGWNVFLMVLLPAGAVGLLRSGRRRGRARGRLFRALLVALFCGGLHALTVSDAAFDPTPYGDRIAAGEIEVDFVLFPPIAKGYAEIDTSAVHRSPRFGAGGAVGLLGTDGLGRDLFVRLLWGGRISLAVGFLSTLVALVLGVGLGALAGFRGGAIDGLVSRGIEVVQAFPAFFLVLTAAALVPPDVVHPMISISLLIGLVRWTGIARLVRGEFLRLREEEFVAAARASGFSGLHIALREILPCAMAPVLVAAAFSVAAGILTESGVSFLGFGVRPPLPSWGALLSETRVPDHWWMHVFPGLLIFATVAAANVVAEGLRERLDPTA